MQNFTLQINTEKYDVIEDFLNDNDAIVEPLSNLFGQWPSSQEFAIENKEAYMAMFDFRIKDLYQVESSLQDLFSGKLMKTLRHTRVL